MQQHLAVIAIEMQVGAVATIGYEDVRAQIVIAVLAGHGEDFRLVQIVRQTKLRQPEQFHDIRWNFVFRA
jgi:hypothetical protein